MTRSKYGKSEAKAVAKERLSGMVTAICLPVDDTGATDEAGLRHDVRYCLETLGSSGLYINGYYSHYWLLTSAERRRTAEIIVDEVAGAVPIICRCASESPAEAVALAKHAEGLGIDFVSLVPPLFGGPEGVNRDLVVGYFKLIADQIDIGISLFNIPKIGYTLSPELIAELAEIPNVCALKNGVPVEHTKRVLALLGDSMVVTDPNEDRWAEMIELGQTLFYTGNNQMFDSAASRPLHDMSRAALEGNVDAAVRIWEELVPVRDVFRRWIRGPWQATNLIPLSAIKHWSGLLGMTGGPVPAPLPQLSTADLEALRADLVRVGMVPEYAAA
jgi:4-hydroxy-tetrahydrodipicolinate synthase